MAIVFVHGFIGSEKTWFQNDNQKFWPALMKNDPAFNGADIYVVTYPTSLGRKYFYPAMAADALQFQLDSILSNYDRIGFIAHSMGGLVIRDYLLDRPIEAAGKVAFIAYFSTPGKGSEVATIAKHFVDNLAVREMDPDAGEPYLVEQHNDWTRTDFDDVPAHCGAETQRTGPFHIVKPLSMTGLCPHTEILGIDADHVGVVKPASTNDASYQIVARAFAQQFGRLPPPPQRRSGTRMIAVSSAGRYEADAGDDRLVVRETQAGTAHPIATPAGLVTWATFTRDENEIYWIANLPGQPAILRRARVIDAQPEQLFELGWADRVAISPDGREIAALRWDYVQLGKRWSSENPRLLILDRDLKEIAQVSLPIRYISSTTGGISWSSDGERIAVPGQEQIHVVSRRGMTSSNWPAPRLYVMHVTWAPEGDWLLAGAYSYGGTQLWRIREGQPPQRITHDENNYHEATFVGSDILAQKTVERSDVWVIDTVAGTAPRRIATGAHGCGRRRRIAWIGDERIVFPSYGSGSRPVYSDPSLDLVILDMVTRRKKRLSREPADASDPVVLADRKTMLYYCKSAQTILCRYRIAENVTEDLHTPLGSWTVAANGFVWATDSQGSMILCRFDADTNTLTPCHTFPQITASSVQPLSERAALYSQAHEIFRIEIGAEPTRLSADCNLDHAAVSPDGTRVVASCTNESKLLDARTGAILMTFGEKLGDPRWSPDGRRIVWIHERHERTEAVVQYLRIANSDGTNRVDIAVAGDRRQFAGPQWSLSGRYLAYISCEFRTEPHYIRNVE